MMRWRMRACLGVVVGMVAAVCPETGAGQSTAGSRPPVYSLVMEAHGCQPKKLTIGAGEVVILVYNRTRLNSLQMQLERVNGARVKDSAVKVGKRQFSEALNLTPGNYVYRDPRGAHLTCEIEVTAGR